MSNLSPGVIRDKHIDYKLESKIILATDFITGQVTGASVVVSSGLGSGTPTLVELGTSGIGAFKLAATTDEIDIAWFPVGVDNTKKIYIRHLWTSDYATANGTATFTTKYSAIKEGAAVIQGATALTKAITASTKVSATARTVYWSPYGIIGPLATGSIAYNTLDPETVLLTIDTVCSAVTGITIASDFVYWIGCEIAYTPRKTFGSGSQRDARMMVNALRPQEVLVANAM